MESLNKERNKKKIKPCRKTYQKKKTVPPFCGLGPFSLKLSEVLCTFTNSTVFLHKLYISIQFSCILVAIWQHNVVKC